MKKLIIFDLDGTLLNTIDDLAHAANHALERGGYPQHEVETYPYYVGNGVGRLIERVLPADHRDEATVARTRAYFQEYYDRHLWDHTRPYPGIEDLLEDLAADGVRLAVASNKYQAATSALIARFFPRMPFDAVHGMRPGIPAKPDPSIVFNILGSTGVAKADALYVGDSGVDIETARRACLENVGVSWGFRPVSELRRFYAEHIASTPADILAIARRPLA